MTKMDQLIQIMHELEMSQNQLPDYFLQRLVLTTLI